MSDATEMTKTFEYVSGVFASCATMLLSADAPLADRGFAVYNWDNIWPKRGTGCKDHSDWLPTFVARHYYRPQMKDREVLTVSAVLWGQAPRSVSGAMAICSYLRNALDAEPEDDIYRWSIVQRWCDDAPPDGKVRELGPDKIRFEGSERRLFTSQVRDANVLTVAVPLPTVTNTTELLERIVTPIIERVLARS